MTLKTYMVLSGVLCLIFLIGCTTPQAVRDLSEKTAINAGIISAQLKSFSRESNQLSELRAANIARLHGVNAALRASYEYDVALAEKSGERSKLSLIGVLTAARSKLLKPELSLSFPAF